MGFAAVALSRPWAQTIVVNIFWDCPNHCNMYKNVYNEAMKYIWDETKRRANLRKHGLDFANASKVFSGPTFTIPDSRFDYGEERFVTIGLLDADAVVIVHTETATEIRIISMRKGTANEQKIFFENI
jgi:uncharacterized protein